MKGKKLPRKPISERTEEETRVAIERFAKDHKLHINPEKHLPNFICRQHVGKHCACKNDELYCPCDVALDEIKATGHCCCWLFVDDRGLEIATRRLARRQAKNPDYRPH